MLLEIPMHPFLVHFPIAIIVLSAAFFVVSVVKNSDKFKEFGFITLLIATVATAVGVMSGMFAEEKIEKPSHELHEHIEKHEMLGFVTLAMVILAAAWMFIRKNKMAKSELTVFTFIMISIVAAVLMTGMEGGELVYEFGAGVEISK